MRRSELGAFGRAVLELAKGGGETIEFMINATRARLLESCLVDLFWRDLATAAVDLASVA